MMPICIQAYTFVVTASGYSLAGVSTYHQVRPGTRLRVGAPRCRPGYPAEGWVVHLDCKLAQHTSQQRY